MRKAQTMARSEERPAASIRQVTLDAEAALPQAVRARLLTLRDSKLCMVDWCQAFGWELRRVEPLLVKCIGELTKTYPDPDTGLRLQVGRRDDFFIAFPTGDFDCDAEDQRLTERDVQLWRLDWVKVEAEFGEGLGLVDRLSKEGQSPSKTGNAATTSRSLSAKRARAGRAKRKVLDAGDRAKIKAAFQLYRKRYETDNAAATEIASLADWMKKENNHLGLKEGYPNLKADDVKRIAGVKK